MSKTYHLHSIADLLLVPADRRQALCDELLLALLMFELALGDDASSAFKPPFTWTDDGRADVSLHINGEELRLEVVPATPQGGA